jgi:hypothetical protein
MSTKPTKAPAQKPPLVLEAPLGESEGETIARAVVTPAIQSAFTSFSFAQMGGFSNQIGQTNANDQIKAVAKTVKEISGGSMRPVEAMLVSQAVALDAVFNALAYKAARAEYIDRMEPLMRMALKAQSQCRATLETLAEVKNPKVAVFANQANVTSGPQQVNNGSPAHGASEKFNTTNELLEHDNGERMDTRPQSTAGREYQTVETLGEIDRAAHQSRKVSE